MVLIAPRVGSTSSELSRLIRQRHGKRRSSACSRTRVFHRGWATSRPPTWAKCPSHRPTPLWWLMSAVGIAALARACAGVPLHQPAAAGGMGPSLADDAASRAEGAHAMPKAAAARTVLALSVSAPLMLLMFQLLSSPHHQCRLILRRTWPSAQRRALWARRRAWRRARAPRKPNIIEKIELEGVRSNVETFLNCSTVWRSLHSAQPPQKGAASYIELVWQHSASHGIWTRAVQISEGLLWVNSFLSARTDPSS